MLKENSRLISRLERIGDVLIIISSFFLAYHGRGTIIQFVRERGWKIPFEGDVLAPLSSYAIVLVTALIGYSLMLSAMGAYSSMRLSSPLRLIKVAFLSSLVVFFLLAATLFLLKLDLSRSFILIFTVSAMLGLACERYLVLHILRFWRRRGMNFRNVLIVGTGEQAQKLAGSIANQPELGLLVRAFVDLKGITSADQYNFRQGLRAVGFESVVRMLNGGNALKRALTDYAIDEVIFTDVVEVMSEVEDLVISCSDQGIRATLAADLFSIGLVKSGISYFGDTPLIHFQTPPGDRWELSVKRAIDFIGASMLLLALSPLLIAVAIGVKRSSPGPVIFRQKRIGLNGRIFEIYKFRSMVLHDESVVEALRDLNEMEGPAFKITNDPRITNFGRLMRRFSLDEFPQLWNVVRGEMSLVGPRPPLLNEVSRYGRRDRRRFSMRPGLTCTWQVSGRNNISSFEEWLKLDLDYIDNWSLSRDLWLLAKTVPAVLLGNGAK